MVLFCFLYSPGRLSAEECLTKRVGRPLLVTAAVRDRFTFEGLPPREVSGIEGGVMIFALTGRGMRQRGGVFCLGV